MTQQIVEEWRPIPGAASFYEVSNFGEVRSWGPIAQGRVIATRNHKYDGNSQVRLMGRDGRKRWLIVHELVAEAFPEEEEG